MFLSINVDCFECQVWSQIHHHLRNCPLVIVGGNPEHANKIFSYNYEAKSYGISREDTVESAKLKCSSLVVFRTNSDSEFVDAREKIQRSISNSVAEKFGIFIELHWVDDAYLNVEEMVDVQMLPGAKYFEENSWSRNTKWIICSFSEETNFRPTEDILKLQVGANILAEILGRLENDTGFFASGGVGYTKTVAQLACPLNKPRGITTVTPFGVETLLALVKIKSAPEFKGETSKKILSKFKKPDGTNLETLQDLKQHVPFKDLSDAGYVDRSNADVNALIRLIYFD